MTSKDITKNSVKHESLYLCGKLYLERIRDQKVTILGFCIIDCSCVLGSTFVKLTMHFSLHFSDQAEHFNFWSKEIPSYWSN